jgi:hypothetical protein
MVPKKRYFRDLVPLMYFRQQTLWNINGSSWYRASADMLHVYGQCLLLIQHLKVCLFFSHTFSLSSRFSGDNERYNPLTKHKVHHIFYASANYQNIRTLSFGDGTWPKLGHFLTPIFLGTFLIQSRFCPLMTPSTIRFYLLEPVFASIRGHLNLISKD